MIPQKNNNAQAPGVIYAPYIPVSTPGIVIDGSQCANQCTSTMGYTTRNFKIRYTNPNIFLDELEDCTYIKGVCNYLDLIEQIQENQYINSISDHTNYTYISFKGIKNAIKKSYDNLGKDLNDGFVIGNSTSWSVFKKALKEYSEAKFYDFYKHYNDDGYLSYMTPHLYSINKENPSMFTIKANLLNNDQ